MTFIKVGHVVLNTDYIAVVKLESQTCSGEKSVSILMTVPKFLLQGEATPSNSYHYEWLDFTGREAKVLQDYFSSFDKVIDLLSEQQ